MQREIFSPLAIDALGEMMNISLGSSATAVSNMLDRRVDITTPKVSVVDIDEFSIAEIEPAMGVEIKYVSGLEGSNIMLLKKGDIKVIVDILMGQEDSGDEEFELNELTVSAVCEVMNQMMGASATALSDFLGYSVNISTPSPFEMHDFNAFKRDHIPHVTNMIVVIRFALKIEDKLESEFMNVISVELARELLNGLGLEEEDILGPEAHLMGEAPAQAQSPASEPGSKPLTQEEIEKLMSGGASEPEPEVSNKPLSQEEIEKLMSGGASTPEPEVSNKPLSQEEIEKLMGGGASAEPAPAPQPQAVPVQPVQPVTPVYAQPTPVAPMGGVMGPSDPGLATNILVMGIVAVATACTVWFGFLGIIFGIIGLNKAKKFTEECGQLFGKAKVGKFLSLGGLIAGSCVTAYVVFYIFIAVITAIAEYS